MCRTALCSGNSTAAAHLHQTLHEPTEWNSSPLTANHPTAAPASALLQEVAQGRVWSGKRAVGLGLVDALGGLNRALRMAKEAAGLAADESVRVLEVSRAQVGGWAVGGSRGCARVWLLVERDRVPSLCCTTAGHFWSGALSLLHLPAC